MIESDHINFTEPSPIQYVGAAHETHAIVLALDLPNANWQVRAIEIGADHGGFGYGEYTLTVFYEPHSDVQGGITERISEVFFESTASRLFDLIGNLQAVTFSVSHERTASVEINDYDYRFNITRGGVRRWGSYIPDGIANTPSDNSLGFTISAAERDTDTSAVSHFDARIISTTFADTGFGMNDDFGGYDLVFELENTSGRGITADISAVFRFEHGDAGTLLDQDVHFEQGQIRQFTHSFGEYVDSSHLLIEYMNVR
jgi:hypothetical protein